MPDEARAMAREFGVSYYETSVLTYYGVNEVFENAIRAALISRKNQRFWMTNLKKVQKPLLQVNNTKLLKIIYTLSELLNEEFLHSYLIVLRNPSRHQLKSSHLRTKKTFSGCITNNSTLMWYSSSVISDFLLTNSY